MKQIFLFVLAITLFSYLLADGFVTCPLLKGICCTEFYNPDACKCVDTSLSECRLYSGPCADKSKRRIYVQKGSNFETKCIA